MKKRAIVPLRAATFVPARAEGGEAYVVFTSPHAEVQAVFEWSGGELHFKGKKQVYGHTRSIPVLEWAHAVYALRAQCRMEAGERPPSIPFRADIDG